METTAATREEGRGFGLLIAHCNALTRPEDAPAPAVARLEVELGRNLTRLLVRALAVRRREQALAA